MQSVARAAAEKGMSQSDLARRLGVGQAAVSKWYQGANAPRKSMIPKLARILEISAKQLVDDLYSDNPPTATQ